VKTPDLNDERKSLFFCERQLEVTGKGMQCSLVSFFLVLCHRMVNVCVKPTWGFPWNFTLTSSSVHCKKSDSLDFRSVVNLWIVPDWCLTSSSFILFNRLHHNNFRLSLNSFLLCCNFNIIIIFYKSRTKGSQRNLISFRVASRVIFYNTISIINRKEWSSVTDSSCVFPFFSSPWQVK